MTENIFNLLQQSPVVSIVLGFILVGFLAWVFRSVIADYIKKKYNLYSEDEIKQGLEKSFHPLQSPSNNSRYLLNQLKHNRRNESKN